MPTSSALEQVQALYVAYYGRPGEPGGLTYWATRLDDNGGDMSALINAFGQSQEYLDRFGSLDDAQRVESLYQQLFGRAADSEGHDYYVGVLARGEKNLAEIALTVANAAQGDDRSVLDARVEAADEFTATLTTPAAIEAYSTPSGLATAQEKLTKITVDTLSESNAPAPAPGEAVSLGDDGVLHLEDGADISDLTLEGAEYLVITDAASVKMTPDQLGMFSAINAGRAGTPGHETVLFTDTGTVDLTDPNVSYNYVEEYRLSDSGNSVLSGDDGYWIVGGAGDDSVTAGAGYDAFTYSAVSGGADTLIGFDLRNDGADELNFIGVTDMDALVATIDSLQFVDNGSSHPGAPSVDLTMVFQGGGLLTLVDQFEAGLDVEAELGLVTTSGSGQVADGQSVVVSGVTGNDLSAMFGDSLFIGY